MVGVVISLTARIVKESAKRALQTSPSIVKTATASLFAYLGFSKYFS